MRDIRSQEISSGIPLGECREETRCDRIFDYVQHEIWGWIGQATTSVGTQQK